MADTIHYTKVETDAKLNDVRKIAVTGINGDLSKVLASDIPTNGYYKYDVFNAGTYTNVTPNITVTQLELDNNYVYVLVKNGVAYKELSEKPKVQVDQDFNANSSNAIANKRATVLAKVLDSFTRPSLIRNVEMNSVTEGLIDVNTGTIISDSGYRYQKINLQSGEKNVYFNGIIPLTLLGVQSKYPTIMSGDINNVLTGLLDSAINTLPNPTQPIETTVSIPDGAQFIYVVWQKVGISVPIVNMLASYEQVQQDSVKKYVDSKISFDSPDPNIISVPISKYTGLDDPNLQNGTVMDGGIYVPNSSGDKVGWISIPIGAKYISSCNFSCFTYLQFADSTPARISGTSSNLTNVKIPANAARIYFNARTKNTNKVNFSTDSILFNTNEINKIVGDQSLQNTIIKTNNSGEIMLSEKIYSIDIIEKRLYIESLFSGFEPRKNYNIEATGNQVMAGDGNKGRFILLNDNGSLTIRVFDLNRIEIASKTTTIYKATMPTTIKKLPLGSGTLQVMIIGDSLWHYNQNKIGKEWLRMLNTNSPGSTDGNILYKPAYNMGAGRIELVGMQGDSTNKYTIANSLEIIMETTIPYNNGTSGNPFFRPDSGMPNELDDDGINKQMDFPWFIQSVCGTGKYPKYIYFACGVNDIIAGGWNENNIPSIKERLKRVLYRIKQACDTIAGGSSDVKILLVNHQYYPLNSGHTFDDGFSCSRQRRLWTKHYNLYESAIKNESYKGVALSSFVRYVDCASSFDVDNGYSYDEYTQNTRSTTIEYTVNDVVHMGTMGSLMYADGLLDDFLFNECQ
ncbi:hypothetical protein [Elizabethkingia bruuniana]|uniref:hypothetical protein n=1 Tax=Elizabethkingia bruuniana TaxID=1756149 RepID=UPI000999F96E|nr:hypothetical protein [Elizabethkingia bruuniana]OPC53409.1 hypothetical protein BAY07_15265 [Elizabethkingia bruuniana]